MVVKDYIDAKITYLNTQLTDDLTETSVSLNDELLPANQLHRFYQIRIDDPERENIECSKVYTVNGSIKMSFGTFKKEVSEIMSIYDTYVNPLVKLLMVGNTNGAAIPYGSNPKLIDMDDFKTTGLKDIIKTNYLQPEITFKARVYES